MGSGCGKPIWLAAKNALNVSPGCDSHNFLSLVTISNSLTEPVDGLIPEPDGVHEFITTVRITTANR